MKIIEALGIDHYFGAESVLKDINVQINSGEKIGLIGINGSGKTTLIRILNKNLEPESGNIWVDKSLTIAIVEQVLKFSKNDTIQDILLQKYKAVLDRLRDTELALENASKKRLPALLKEYEKARDNYDLINGDFLLSNGEKYLNALGLFHDLDGRVDMLSGGEQNLLGLVSALIIDPDLLILDEPGNHLDMQGLNWLESFLSQWSKAILIISHNRFMLDRVCDTIWELENKRITVYSGNYSSYRITKLQNLVNQQTEYKANQIKLQRLENLVKKFKEYAERTADPSWGKRYRARKSQLKREKEKAIEEPKLHRGKISVGFGSEQSKADIALQIKDYSLGFPGIRLFDDINLEIRSGERVALIGVNGSGKTSLIKMILEYGKWDNENLRLGPSQNIGYLSQKPEELKKDISLEEYFRSLGPITKSQAFTYLSPLLFTYDDMDKPLSAFSGGEMNRIQLGVLMYQKANFLILDEPTNHMDIASREAIEEALEQFKGTILIISHDRYFLEKIINRIVLIEDRTLKDFSMDLGDFLIKTNWLKKSKGMIKTRHKERKSKVGFSEAKLEKKIEDMEKEKLQMEKKIEDAFNDNKSKIASDLNNKLKKLNKILDSLYEQYLN